jgi:hypothetical protein
VVVGGAAQSFFSGCVAAIGADEAGSFGNDMCQRRVKSPLSAKKLGWDLGICRQIAQPLTRPIRVNNPAEAFGMRRKLAQGSIFVRRVGHLTSPSVVD